MTDEQCEKIEGLIRSIEYSMHNRIDNFEERMWDNFDKMDNIIFTSEERIWKRVETMCYEFVNCLGYVLGAIEKMDKKLKKREENNDSVQSQESST